MLRPRWLLTLVLAVVTAALGFSGRPEPSGLQFAAAMYGSGALWVIGLVAWWRRRDRLEFGAGRLRLMRPERRYTSVVEVPIRLVDRFEVRRWLVGDSARRWSRGRARPRISIAIRLVDGAFIEVPIFSDRAVPPRGSTLLVQRGRWRRWRPIRDDDGAVVRWTSDPQSALLDELGRALANAKAASSDQQLPTARMPIGWPEDAGAPPIMVVEAALLFDGHRRRPPLPLPWRGRRSESIVGGDDPILPPPNALASVPAPPPTVPEPEHAWPNLVVPARYWSLASERAGSVLRRRPCMRFEAEGLRFHRRAGSDLTVSYSEADRFDLMLAPGNVWQLRLFRRSGQPLAVDGLDHGSFPQNRLFWATGPAAADTRAPATGAMAWPDADLVLVVYRLNAHLAAARTAADPDAANAGRVRA